MSHLSGHPEHLQRSLLGCAGLDHLVVAVEFVHQLGDAVVGIGGVGVGPHHDPALGRTCAPTRRAARAPVVEEGSPGCRYAFQLLARTVRAVVHRDDFAAVVRCVERCRMAVDLFPQVAPLVVHGEHHGDIELGARR